MEKYDIIKKETGQRCAVFEISVDPSDSSLKRIRAMRLDLTSYETSVPSGIGNADILRDIVYNLFPEKNADSFSVR